MTEPGVVLLNCSLSWRRLFGWAYFNNRNNQVFAPGCVLFETSRFTDTGITAGVDFEYMFTPTWSVFAEANFHWTEDTAADDYVSPACPAKLSMTDSD